MEAIAQRARLVAVRALVLPVEQAWLALAPSRDSAVAWLPLDPQTRTCFAASPRSPPHATASAHCRLFGDTISI